MLDYFGFFKCKIEGFFYYYSMLSACSFHDETHAVIFEHNCLKLEACAGWFMGGRGAGEALYKPEECFTHSGGDNRLYPVEYYCLVPLTLPTCHTDRAEKADAAASFLQSRTKSLLISWKGGTVCELCELLHPFFFFFFYWGLVCVVLGGWGVEQTQNRLYSSVLPL